MARNETVGKIVLPNAAFSGKDYVYFTEYNYFDLAVDENGLWVIYAAEAEPHSLLVSKLDLVTLRAEKTWNISVTHQNFGNGFIVCGVLYLVQDATQPSTVISYAYDLYTKEVIVLPGPIKFLNPFQMNIMIAYNPRDKKIYSWDNGNQLIYPILASQGGR